MKYFRDKKLSSANFARQKATHHGALPCYSSFSLDDQTKDLNPPYAIRLASKPEFEDSIKSAILGSAATFSFA